VTRLRELSRPSSAAHLYAFVETLDRQSGQEIAVNWDDETRFSGRCPERATARSFIRIFSPKSAVSARAFAKD